jgi:nucleotide-binding universal stress UspA family protein
MEQYSPKTILLATEGSEGERAARAAIDLSKRTGAKLHAVLAWVPLPHFARKSLVLERYNPPYEGGARRILDAQLGRIEQAGGTVSEAHLIEGRPAEPALEARAAELEDACGVRPSVRLLEGESANGGCGGRRGRRWDGPPGGRKQGAWHGRADAAW